MRLQRLKRLHPIAVIPLILALAALIMTATGPFLPLTIGVATATVLVALAVIFYYVGPSTEVKQVPVENFSLWADVGEPAAELRHISPDNIETAVRIANIDLSSLSSNAELLNARLSLLLGRRGFEELTKEKMSELAENLSYDIQAVTKKFGTEKKFSTEALSSIEHCASHADQIANKLHDAQIGKPEIVHIYLEPLHQASEKLSRDLRLTFANISNFIKGAPAGSEGS